jgi:hypothetical protein
LQGRNGLLMLVAQRSPLSAAFQTTRPTKTRRAPVAMLRAAAWILWEEQKL